MTTTSVVYYYGNHRHNHPYHYCYAINWKRQFLNNNNNRNNCYRRQLFQTFDGSSTRLGSGSRRSSTRIDTNNTNNDDFNDENDERKQELQNQLDWISAIEERNTAQIDSFIDEQDQWDSMEEWERELLTEKQNIQKQFDELCSGTSTSIHSSSSNDARQRAEEIFQLLARRGRSWKRLQHLVDLALSISSSSPSSSSDGRTTTHKVIADIGTDHGLLAIGLALTGHFKKVIGVDVSREALQNGALALLEDVTEKQKLEQHPGSNLILHDRLDFRVGDGLRGLRNDEIVNVVCIAGMGARTMTKILNALADDDTSHAMATGSDNASNPLRLIDKVACQNLILQPTNSRPRHLIELYDELHSSGWTLQDERIESLSGRWYITALFSRSNVLDHNHEREGGSNSDLPCSKLIDPASVDTNKATLEGYISHHSRWLPHNQMDLRWLAEFGDGVRSEEENI